MQKKISNAVPQLLMSASMFMLALFLFLFLRKTWNEEKTALIKESGYLFVGAVRNIEGGLLNKMVFHREKTPENESLNVQIQGPSKGDSLRIMTFISSEERHVSPDSGRFEFKVKHIENQTGLSDIQGSISMVIAMEGDSASNYPHTGPDSIQILKELREGFFSAAQKAGLSIGFRIDRASDGARDYEVQAGSYSDIGSGEQYVLYAAGFNAYLLKKTAPQFLFAFGLFAIVGLAFYALFKSLRQQKRLSALKNEFIQNISHELKTPLATMSVAMEALLDFKAGNSPEQSREYIQISQKELQRLSLLVDKVVCLSGPDQEALHLAKNPIPLQDLVTEVLDAFKLQIQKSGAHLKFNCTPGEYAIVGDRLHLSGVIFNLLDNALKYGGEAPAITVSLEQGPNGIRLSVADEGPGIPAAFHDRVFEQFFRAPNPEGHQVKGHGLGLSYAAKIMRQHGGQLSFEALQPRGMVFHADFPKNPLT